VEVQARRPEYAPSYTTVCTYYSHTRVNIVCESLHGVLFRRKCFIRLRLLLVAVAEVPLDDRSTPRVLLNPSGRGQHATVIDARMKGFFICQSEDEAKRVKFYCDVCHDVESNPELITHCSCGEKSKLLIIYIDVLFVAVCHVWICL